MVNHALDGMFRRVLRREESQHPLRLAGDFAVLDGARTPEIFRRLNASQAEYACLYDGELPRRLARAAPYVVDLRASAAFAQWFYEHGWGNACGMIVQSKAGLMVLRRHFRTLAYVLLESGKRVLFRYYDPRVARIFLSTCDDEQLGLFFGPIDYLVVEGEKAEPDEVFEYKPRRGLLRRGLHPAVRCGEQEGGDAASSRKLQYVLGG